jgi:hypothetical protein
MTSTENYNLGAKICTQVLKNGGECIFIHESIKFIKINLLNSCKKQNMEICAVKLDITNINTVIISIYRYPSGNCNYFFLITLYCEPTTQL